MDDAEDHRCMERLRDGDDLALNELMGRWKEPLVAFCLRCTGNRTDACEIAHETFVRIYQARQNYRPASKFSTWMFAIATNLCRMRSRWKRRHPEVLESDRAFERGEPEIVAGHSSDPALQADARQLAADLQRALLTLTHKLRIPFVLRELHGMSYRDIAEVEKTTEKAVERRAARARERLRGLLEATWGKG